MTELILKEEVYEVMGAALDVYYHLGCGFLEPVYQEALGIELLNRQIPHRAKPRLTIYYKGSPLQKGYEADFICYGKIVAELKVLDRLSGREVSQLLNYLKATRHPVGLLINFGSRPTGMEALRHLIYASKRRFAGPISCDPLVLLVDRTFAEKRSTKNTNGPHETTMVFSGSSVSIHETKTVEPNEVKT